MGQSSASDFSFGLNYVSGGVLQTADWIVFNNQTFYFNKTDEESSSNSTKDVILYEKESSSSGGFLSDSNIIIMAVAGACLLALIVASLICLVKRFRKEKLEYKKIVEKQRAQVLFPGYSEEKQRQLDAKYHEFLMKKFGTLEVTA